MAEPSLYQYKSKPTKEKVELARDYQEEYMKVTFMPDDEKKLKTKAYLSKRFDDMDMSRPDDDWEIRYKQFIADVLYTEDGRANINLPIEKATIRNKVADEQSMKAIVNFMPTEPNDIYRVDITKVVWDFVWQEANTDYEITKHRLQTKVFGTSIWWEGVHKEIFTKYEPVIDENGKITGRVREVTKSWLEGKPVDIRDVWIDPVADMADAVDCFIIERDLTFEALEGLKKDPNFDAEAIDRLLASARPKSRSDNDRGSRPFSTAEESIDMSDTKFNLYHYYNKQKGMYIVIDDSFSHIIREGVLPFTHGELPITVLVDHRNLYSIYGYGECELLESTKYERNEIRNQILDGVRISNTMNLLLGEGIAFQGNETVGGIMNVWNVEGNPQQAQFLQTPHLDGAIFNVDQMLQNDATWITGIDNNSLAGAPTKTAFEARLQEQTKLKGISVSLREFDFWLRDMARQRLANIQTFLPTTTGKVIIGEQNEEKYRTIAIKDKIKKTLHGIDKKGNLKEMGVTFEDAEGETEFFELTPELLQSHLDVQVETPTTTPILRDIQNHEVGELINTLLTTAQTPQGQEILKKVDFLALIKRQFRDKGYDPEEFIEEAAPEQKKADLRQKLLQDIPKPPKTAMPGPAMPPEELMPQAPMPGAQGMMPPTLPQ